MDLASFSTARERPFQSTMSISRTLWSIAKCNSVCTRQSLIKHLLESISQPEKTEVLSHAFILKQLFLTSKSKKKNDKSKLPYETC